MLGSVPSPAAWPISSTVLARNTSSSSGISRCCWPASVSHRTAALYSSGVTRCRTTISRRAWWMSSKMAFSRGLVVWFGSVTVIVALLDLRQFESGPADHVIAGLVGLGPEAGEVDAEQFPVALQGLA